MRMRRGGTWVALAVAATGCGDADSGAGGEAQAVCEKLVTQCQAADPEGNPWRFGDCMFMLDVYVMPQACTDAIRTQDCAELVSGAAWHELCFPPCVEGPDQCTGGNALTQCSDGTAVSVRCTTVCSLTANAAWTGVCGPEYQGYGSPDAEHRCWCQ